MQRLAPSLMFVGDQLGRAEEAIELYVSTFADSRILATDRFDPATDGQEGIRYARIELAGQTVTVTDSPGPHTFTFTPAVSLTVEFDSEAELEAAWERLIEGGMALMPLQAYPFSPKFGWLQDRFGVSWQLSLARA